MSQQPEARPPFSQWRVEGFDPSAKEWFRGSPMPTLEAARERLQHAQWHGPTWRHDGSPVERRIVRETTTYSVEE